MSKNIEILGNPQNEKLIVIKYKNCYFMQSSVVKYDDEHSIMLLGDPNAGKTTMAYSLM